MMPSLSGLGWTVCCLLLLSERPSARSTEQRCPAAGSVGPQHPVQGLLERFEAGPGCAASERGSKETHVVALGRVTNSPENKVTVLLKPLSLTLSPLRAVYLVLSSKLPVSWWLEAERLPANLSVLVQVSRNSSVQSLSLRLHVQSVHSLPFRPRALHRWALKHHGNLSSLTHTTHGNRVYLRLGEDLTLPAVCQLQSMFLSHNYMTSDLQQQEVQGCSGTPAAASNPEVHVIKLHSAGSGLCGSLQVEATVSLVPPVAASKSHKVVLILSSSVPVNWAIVAPGVRGRITVHASNSVSPSYPPEPGLTVSSTLNADLSTITDLLVWAAESGYPAVTSYTEADLANRFVIRLAEGGAEEAAAVNPLLLRPSWMEERRLRQGLNGGGRARGGGGGLESFPVKCEDGQLSVAVDQRILQNLSVPVAAVTLQDLTCQAQSNGSHFLLVFPVISCGTEGLLLGEPRGVQYTNVVLLWRHKPQTILTPNETDKSKSPLKIHISCWAAAPNPSSPAADAEDSVNTPQSGLVPWVPRGPGSDPDLSHLPTPRHRSGPVLVLELFINESYEQTRVGPCVVTADHRVYVEISAKGPLADVAQVNSCVISPLSDPKKSPFWAVISDGCSSDSSLTLHAKTKDEEEEGDGDLEEEEETEKPETVHHTTERRGREAMIRKKTARMGAEEEIQPLRFSFILRPVYNNSIQFLHCSLRVCVSDPTRGKPTKETVKKDCQGRLHIPPLVSKPSKHQCEIRNLSRPMVVTQSMSSLIHKMQPPAGPRTKRLSVVPVAGPDPQHSSSVVQIGPVMGIVFAAFVMGVSLMGGLWCIYSHTGGRQVPAGEDYLTDQTPVSQSIWSQPSPSDQFSSSV
ncbi:transforming growth factor beta receptor type 3 [Stegastes partitus]|uniref:Transforming growth factor beta receptor type 3-like n=1 Tax=Stegastes partitus TaxID=144197 RepID=A0A9Y4NLQ2_9TELE|nr:PREDICTED: transforming growth factor beta receptor type 3-like [Stegastes partitus]XP_008299554.1 PREDICTED: transforming growth factor beta receptor type 3-like [Stegastes partitus]